MSGAQGVGGEGGLDEDGGARADGGASGAVLVPGMFGPGDRLPDILRHFSAQERQLVLEKAGPQAILGAQQDFANWSHDGQDAPPGDWSSWVIMAGRGFGKTRAGAEWIAAQARREGRLRIALVAASLDEARRIMVEGNSGLLAVAGDSIRQWAPGSRFLRFTSGAEAVLFSGCSPEGLRGPEHHIAWCDELAKWDKAQDSWDMLQLGLRLDHPGTGAGPRVVVTTTPRPGPVLTRIMAAEGCIVTRGATRANPHLSRHFLRSVEGLYAGTRLGRQELEGELFPGVAGALLSPEVLDRWRVGIETGTPYSVSPGAGGEGTRNSMSPVRTVVGVDPPAGDGTCGIVVCALGADGTGYVLADRSVRGRSPEGWAAEVCAAAWDHQAERAVVEINQGGAMVQAVLRASDPALAVSEVRAREGKAVRAEPITLLFETGRIRLAGHFSELEAELCGLISGGGYEGPGRSPDRADACIWALTALMLGPARAAPRVRLL